jgi:hypothetical protein
VQILLNPFKSKKIRASVATESSRFKIQDSKTLRETPCLPQAGVQILLNPFKSKKIRASVATKSSRCNIQKPSVKLPACRRQV